MGVCKGVRIVVRKGRGSAAAANASLSTIKLLLVSGADPYQTDSKGFRAIDYLLGYGPTPPNPVLSKSDRVKAQELLY